MASRILADLAATKALATEVAASLQGGEIIGLVGDLGTGKTTFTQELAAALDVRAHESARGEPGRHLAPLSR
jgi:tRNA A37 threonylcarbamoyladenosine biosynthesis protein TsaE